MHDPQVDVQAERRRQMGESLAELGRLVTQSLDPAEVAQRIVSGARVLLGAKAAAVFKEDGVGDLVTIGYGADSGAGLGPDVVIPRGVGAMGLAMRERTWIVTPDALADARLHLSPGLHAHLAGTPYRAVLAVPLLAQDRAVGALALVDEAGRVFDPDEIRLAGAFGDFAAIALENSRLYTEAERRRREQADLARAARALTETLDVAAVGDQVVSIVRPLFGVKSAVLRLRQPDGSLVVVATTGAYGDQFPVGHVQLPGEGAASRAAAECRAVWSRGQLRDPAVRLGDDLRRRVAAIGDLAVLAVPLHVKDKVLGVLIIGAEARREFSPGEVGLLQAFADQASIALENAQLYAESEARRHTAQALLDIAAALGATRELKDVLGIVSLQAARAVGAERCSIALLRDGRVAPLMAQFADGHADRTLWDRFRAIGPFPIADLPAVAEVVGTGRPVAIDDTSRDARLPASWVEAFGTRAALIVPLLHDEEVIGLLSFGITRGPHPWRPSQTELATAIASQAALAIERTRAYAEAERRRRTAEALADVGRLLCQSLDPREVAQRIVVSARGLLGVITAGVFRVDAGSGDLALLARSGDGAASLDLGGVLPRGTGLVGLAVQERCRVFTSDLLADPAIVLPADVRRRLQGTPARARLALPLVTGGHVVGALTIGDAVGRVFTEDDIRLVEAFASHAAVALENARLHAETERRRLAAESLAQMGRLISESPDPAVVARRIAHSVRELLAADSAALYCLEAGDGDVTPLAFASGPEDLGGGRLMQSWAARVCAIAIAEHATVMTPDILEDPRLPLTDTLRAQLATSAQRSILAVPIVLNRAVIGVLALVARTGRVFDAEHIALVEAFADRASLALESTRLQGEIRQRLTQTETLLAVAQVVASTVEPTETLRRVARATARALGADMAGAYLPDADERALWPVAGYHVPEHLREAFRQHPIPLRGHQILEAAWKERRPCWSSDVDAEPAIDRDAFRRFPHRSGLFVPMIVADRPIAALYIVWWERSHLFVPEEIRLVEAIARQAGLAAANAELYQDSERRRREAEALGSVMRRVSASLNRDEVARMIVESVDSVFACDGATLRLARPDDTLVVLASSGRLREHFPAGLVHPYSGGLSGRALRLGRPVWSADVQAEPATMRPDDFHRRNVAAGIRGALAVPLIVKDRIVGVLAVVDDEAREFSEDEIRLLQAFGDQAALAIENARLYEETDRRRRELEIAQAALRESEERYRSVVINLPDVTWWADRTGRPTFISPNVEKACGFTPEEICAGGAEAWSERIHPDDLERVRRRYERLFETREIFDVEYRVRRKDGQWIWIHDRAVAIEERDGEPFAYGVFSDVTERKRAAEIRARLLEKVMTAQEEERGRVARELHDETAQTLVSLRVGLNQLEGARTLTAARAQARDLNRLVATGVTEVRRLAWGLRPSVLDDLGLAAALERYVDETVRSRGLKVDVQLGGLGGRRLPRVIETALYRIAQEALTNAIKHAAAKSVTLTLERRPASVWMAVRDDGHGFDSAAALAGGPASMHFGLHGMRERATLLNGSATIVSDPIGGTQVLVELPLAD